MSDGAFAASFPTLFHVTECSALPTIRAWGLLSAARLCDVLGVPEADRPALLEENRKSWCRIGGRSGEVVRLRRQGMSDEPLRTRLAPGLTPTTWRRFINGMVFLFTDEDDAWRLRWAKGEEARAQTVLAFDTHHLLESGADLAFCPFNNGYLDRSPPGRRRLRAEGDYRSVCGYGPGDRVREVVVRGGVASTVPFEECPVHLARG